MVYFLLSFFSDCAGVYEKYICFFGVLYFCVLFGQNSSNDFRVVDVHLASICLNMEGGSFCLQALGCLLEVGFHELLESGDLGDCLAGV